MHAIPRIIHQTGRSQELPFHLEGLQSSWLALNPGYDYRYWSDEDLERFVAEHASDWLDLFLAFPEGDCRDQLGRFLLLRHHGGIAADLACQCLRPLDGLIGRGSFLIAAEPGSPAPRPTADGRGPRRLLGPSFLACRPGHPFWDRLLEETRRDPQEAEEAEEAEEAKETGAHLLTRTALHHRGEPITELPAELIHPFSRDECRSGQVFDPQFWQRRTREAFVAHYWDFSWFPARPILHLGVPTAARAHVSAPPSSAVREPRAAPPPGSPGGEEGPELPLISCLMVTRGRCAQALAAIACFLAQSYCRRELVIVDDDESDALERAVAALGSERIRHLRLPDRGLPLGHLRNVALDHAAGELMCQWDDDDLYDPLRLEMQFRVLRAASAQACVLMRWLMRWPAQRRLAVSLPRDWEGSLLCERAVLPPYPELRRREDTAVMETLLATVRVVRLDLPRLYLYTVHGRNTCGPDHFEAHWQGATARWEGEEAERLLREVQRRLPRGAAEPTDLLPRPSIATAAASPSPAAFSAAPLRQGID